ncbi:probable trafficking protein particle complex subunit 13 homolog [Culicoides brevitarsis]|uniref:probable trafficking protein particle complex subunit 13 homolog n=1 Tax=Culicoides brevitarsis TaxID=469753 RepID=UPI00307BBF8B
MTTDSKEYLLALKVMCLTRPTLLTPQIVSCEPIDLPQKSFEHVLKKDITAVPELPTVGSGQFMLLPQAFRNIYLGETFSSYICVYNNVSHPVHKVRVNAYLQTLSTKINLPIHSDKQAGVTLETNGTLDDIIHHEVKEIGNHVLVCEVMYETPAGLPESFRKFFKFQVVKPLDVQTKFYNAETGEIFLEAQIQNKTTSAICLEKVDLQSSDKYSIVSLNTLPNGDSVFTSKNMLQPNNCCQFLYCIKPNPELSEDIRALQTETGIGKLDIVWRSNLGEKGRLQTSQLQKSNIDYGDLRVSIVEAKSTVRIGEAFNFVLRITNTSERSMDLTLNLNANPKAGSSYAGTTEFNIGNIERGKSKDVDLTVVPTKLGLVTVSNLQLTDLKKTYEFEDFVQVYVVEQDYKEDEFDMDKFVKYCTITA